MNSNTALDVETGLPSRQALDMFVRLARRVGRKTTLIRLTWLGDSRPTEHQAKAVAHALSACKDDAALAARLDDTQFAVLLCEEENGSHSFLSRLRDWLEPHLPLSISFHAEA